MDRVFKSHTGEADAQLLAEAQKDVGLIALLERNAGAKDDTALQGTVVETEEKQEYK